MFTSSLKSSLTIGVVRSFAAAAFLTTVAASAAPPAVKDLDIFVDPPTAFVFIKMPQGWKFVGKLDAAAMRELPPNVHTSLLSPADTTAGRVIVSPAAARLRAPVAILPSPPSALSP